MRGFSLNYKERDGNQGRHLVSRGFWLIGVPRLLILCRLFGHRAVVDGTRGFRDGDPGSRWVVCDRCGVRPDPQGDLDPATWNIGDRYRGTWMQELSARWPERSLALNALKHAGWYPPGPWPRRPEGELGGHIVLGEREPRIGFEFKVGNKGSEHTLAASFNLPWIGSLYLHTERFGEWLVRRLNPVGYQSRVTGVQVHNGRLHWTVWSKRDDWSSKDPWWSRGSVQVDPRTLLLGPKRYAYEDVGEPTTVTVRMPHGDDHEVRLQLQRQTFGRRRGRKRLAWNVDWSTRPGIPTKPDGRGRISGSGISVCDEAVSDGTWAFEAAARIAVRMTESRRSNGWKQSQEVPA